MALAYQLPQKVLRDVLKEVIATSFSAKGTVGN